MVLDGYFIRGAISAGDVFVDEIAVFGPALIEAYKGESELARDPRIILTDSAIALTKQHLDYYPNKNWAPQNHHILCDSDGQWFLNYLDVLLPDTDVVLYEDLIKHKEIIETQLEKHAQNPKIWAKYSWTARYHNYFCKKHTELFSEEHYVNISKFEATPQPII